MTTSETRKKVVVRLGPKKAMPEPLQRQEIEFEELFDPAQLKEAYMPTQQDPRTQILRGQVQEMIDILAQWLTLPGDWVQEIEDPISEAAHHVRAGVATLKALADDDG